MKIIIGSGNSIKIEAVKETLNEYENFRNAEILGIETDSGVSEQPKSLDETVKGAVNRAKSCFNNCDFSFGIESGFMKVPGTKTGYMNLTCCAIFDGDKIHLGLSSAFEAPIKATKLIFEKGLDVNQAFHKTGLTNNPRLGSFEGAVGFLTKGRLSRKDYTKQAIVMALIHLENPDLY